MLCPLLPTPYVFESESVAWTLKSRTDTSASARCCLRLIVRSSRFRNGVRKSSPRYADTYHGRRKLSGNTAESSSPGGRLVINAIRKEDADKEALLRLDYPVHLWMEKEIKSVANVSRRDVSEFLTLAADMRIKPEVQEFGLEEANVALVELKTRKIRGAKVLRVD